MTDMANIPKTALEVFKMLPEGTAAEVLFNTLYMSPAPKYKHQRMVNFLNVTLYNYVKSKGLGEVIVSPFDVYLEDFGSAVQPDILYITNSTKAKIQSDGYLHGAPELIVEVLSRDKRYDKGLKKKLYEKAGVLEYFAVDCETLEVIRYEKRDQGFTETKSKGLLHSQLLGISITLE